ncbi:MAG: hypothetical protein HXY51_07620, partial [Nitrospirae bacterium]|nr:hypothetical protein [Nitrospirota bacterium]
MMKNSVRFLFPFALIAVLVVSAKAGPTEAPPAAPSQQQPVVASAPPEDPLFPQDISAWTYTPEFAERF